MLATAILHACGNGLTSATTGGTAGSAGVPIVLGIGALAAVLIAAAVLTIGILIVATVAAMTGRTTSPAPAAVAVPAGATFSPDGYYWWDGAAWRPVL